MLIALSNMCKIKCIKSVQDKAGLCRGICSLEVWMPLHLVNSLAQAFTEIFVSLAAIAKSSLAQRMFHSPAAFCTWDWRRHTGRTVGAAGALCPARFSELIFFWFFWLNPFERTCKILVWWGWNGNIFSQRVFTQIWIYMKQLEGAMYLDASYRIRDPAGQYQPAGHFGPSLPLRPSPTPFPPSGGRVTLETRSPKANSQPAGGSAGNVTWITETRCTNQW